MNIVVSTTRNVLKSLLITLTLMGALHPASGRAIDLQPGAEHC